MLVVGYTEHGGARHLIIRNPNDGTKSLLPEWMTFVETAAIRIVSCPRFYVNRLVELRALIDRLMAPSSGNHVPPPEPDLFKIPLSNELAPTQRTRALELLKAFLKEAMSAIEVESNSVVHQEADDD